MKLHPRVTRTGLELVKRFEGLRRRAARLPDGGWTVGYGHTRSAREDAVVSPEDADALLYYDLSEVAEKVEAWTFTPLSQNQFEALTAFAFNIGIENFRRSTVLKRLNEGQYLRAAAALELWRKADFGGEDLVVDALVRRRAAEKAHFLTPPEGFRPSPSPVLKPTFDHSVIEAAAHAQLANVVDAPMDGEDAIAVLERPADPIEFPIAPPLAAVAAGSVFANLHQLFPEKAETADALPESFALEREQAVEAQEPLPISVNDGSFGQTAEPALRASDPPHSHMPAPLSTFQVGGFGDFAPPPVRRFETTQPSPTIAPPPFDTFEDPPPVIEAPAFSQAPADATPLFDTPSQRAAFPMAEDVYSPSILADEPVVQDREHPHAEEGFASLDSIETPTAGPLRNRSVIYVSIGLLGVALFAAALFSMLSGKASPLNLVIGVMGILLMTPAGGYFLLRFLNRRDELTEI